MGYIALIVVAIGTILFFFGNTVAGLVMVGLGAILAVIALARSAGRPGRRGGSGGDSGGAFFFGSGGGDSCGGGGGDGGGCGGGD